MEKFVLLCEKMCVRVAENSYSITKSRTRPHPFFVYLKQKKKISKTCLDIYLRGKIYEDIVVNALNGVCMMVALCT